MALPQRTATRLGFLRHAGSMASHVIAFFPGLQTIMRTDRTGLSADGVRLARMLTRIAMFGMLPAGSMADTDPELAGQMFRAWVYQNQIRFTSPARENPWRMPALRGSTGRSG